MDFGRLLSPPWLLPLIIIGSGAAVFALLMSTAPATPTEPPDERSWLVATESVKFSTLAPTLTLYGQVETPALLNAAAPGKSRVTSINIKEGDRVDAGQLLLELDERDFKPKLIQAQARAEELRALIASEQLRYRNDKISINHEKSILTLQEQAVKRAEELKRRKLGSQAALEEAQEALKRQQLAFTTRQLALDDHEARLRQLHARLAYAEAEEELARLNWSRSRIMAPFDGYVEQLSVAEGDQVAEAQILLTLYPKDQLEVRAKIPAAFLHEIQHSLLENIVLPAEADYAGARLSLLLDRLSGKADSRGIDALFRIQSGSEWVRLGAAVSVVLHRPAKTDVIALPYSAIYDNNRVYRVVAHRIQAVKVDILGEYGPAEQIRLLVRSTQLQTGDQVVTTQLPGAVSGMKVEIK